MRNQMKIEEKFAKLGEDYLNNLWIVFFFFFFFWIYSSSFENRFLGTSEIFSAHINMMWKQQKMRKELFYKVLFLEEKKEVKKKIQWKQRTISCGGANGVQTKFKIEKRKAELWTRKRK